MKFREYGGGESFVFACFLAVENILSVANPARLHGEDRCFLEYKAGRKIGWIFLSNTFILCRKGSFFMAPLRTVLNSSSPHIAGGNFLLISLVADEYSSS